MMKRLRNRHKAGGKRLALFCAASGTGIVLALMGMDRLHGLPREENALTLTSANWEQGPDTAPGVSRPTPLIKVNADATQSGPADLTALNRALEGTLLAPDRPSAGTEASPSNAAAPDSGANWFFWGRFAGQRIYAETIRPEDLPETVFKTYAVRSRSGTSVCLVNRADRKVQVAVRLRLPRGIYCIERLTFSPDSAPPPTENGGQKTQDNLPVQPPASNPPSPALSRLERLESRNMMNADVVSKRLTLEPGQVCLVRCTDQAQVALRARREAYDSLQDLAASYPGPARALRRVLNESSPYADSLYAASVSKRLSCIHHLLLLTAQAQAMARNYVAEQVIGASAGAAVMGALERLTDALAEASAAALNLVPQITVVRELSPMDGADGAAINAAMPPAPASEQRVTVTIALTNAGEQSVAAVKIGQDSSAMPPGTVCEPTDPAYFGALHPGQTVRAAFQLRCPARSPFPDSRCVGDISYFIAGAPAHLRLRPW
jgi:hypothetical protein